MAVFGPDTTHFDPITRSFEPTRGTNGHDFLLLGDRYNVASGMSGYDFMPGSNQRDVLYAGRSEDGRGEFAGSHMAGFDRDDQLFGDDGADRISGGRSAPMAGTS